MMKNTSKFVLWILLAALIFLPLQAVQARGLAQGPIFGGNFTLKSGETLNEDVIVFGGTVSIEKDARLNGAVVLFGGSATLDGEVSKDVVVMGGAVKLGADAHIRGNLVTFGAPVNRASGARVDGDVVTDPVRPDMPGVPVIPQGINVNNPYDNPLWNVLFTLGQSFMMALLAVMIAMFMPVQMRRVADGVVAQPFITLGMGLLTLILFIVTIVALALFSVFIITMFITVPLIVVIAIVFAAGSVLGWLALGMEVGVRLGQVFNREWPLALAAGLGMFLLNLVAQSIGFIPCIGALLAGIVGFAGLGAVFMTRFGTRAATLSVTPAPVMMPDNS